MADQKGLTLTALGTASAYRAHEEARASSYLVQGGGSAIVLDLGQGAYVPLAVRPENLPAALKGLAALGEELRAIEAGDALGEPFRPWRRLGRLFSLRTHGLDIAPQNLRHVAVGPHLRR